MVRVQDYAVPTTSSSIKAQYGSYYNFNDLQVFYINSDVKNSSVYHYVTGSAKTDHIVPATKIEIAQWMMSLRCGLGLVKFGSNHLYSFGDTVLRSTESQLI